MAEFDCMKLENQLCFPLYACSKEMVRRYKPHLDALDLTYTQYITMLVLWEQGEISAKELGNHLYLDSGTLTPVLKTLEKKGYLLRARKADDERVLLVSLTPEGTALREQAVEIPKKMGGCLPLNCEDARELRRLLGKILEGFET